MFKYKNGLPEAELVSKTEPQILTQRFLTDVNSTVISCGDVADKTENEKIHIRK